MIKVHNDGKEKYQSFEASIDIQGLGDVPALMNANSHGNAHVTGYGATEEEAITNMKKAAVAIQVEIARAIAQSVQYVDCLGEPLKK